MKLVRPSIPLPPLPPLPPRVELPSELDYQLPPEGWEPPINEDTELPLPYEGSAAYTRRRMDYMARLAEARQRQTVYREALDHRWDLEQKARRRPSFRAACRSYDAEVQRREGLATHLRRERDAEITAAQERVAQEITGRWQPRIEKMMVEGE